MEEAAMTVQTAQTVYEFVVSCAQSVCAASVCSDDNCMIIILDASLLASLFILCILSLSLLAKKLSARPRIAAYRLTGAA